MELRDYQKRQLNYLMTKDNTKEVVGIESPTGSGKSFVILSYIKHYFNKYNDQTIVITTGSNNLVYDFANTAAKFGLDPIIYVGSSMLTCYEKEVFLENSNRNQVFSRDREDLCSTVKSQKRIIDEETGNLKVCDQCKKCKFPHLRELKEELHTYGNHLIITNHQAYLTHVFADKPIYKPDMVIVDEAHMFGTFYSNWLNVDISKNEVANIIAALGDKPQAVLFKTFLERGEPIPTQLLNRIIELIKAYYKKISNMSQYGYELCSRLINFSSDFKNNEDVYFIISPSGMTRINFWHKFNIAQSTMKYRLFTATLDRFTRIMFGMNPDDYDNNFYIEKNLNLIDYTKSDAYIIKINDFNTALNDFIKLCEEKDYKSGLILSTTIENVSNLKEQGNVGRYKVYTKINDFRDADGYKVLVGSRAMFQGIDIPEINFVAINKIPFETYDEEFKKRVAYLKKWASIDPWTDYSIPLVKNALIQSTGRLWRGPDNFGSVGIFDGRLVERFKYLLDTIIEVRNGISLYISGEDKPDLVEDFEEIIQDESKIKK